MKGLLSTRYSEAAFNFALLLLRVVFGLLILVNHGIPKLMHFAGLSTKFYAPFHMGHQLALILMIFAEVFCAIFLVIGLFSRLAAIPLVVGLAVAVFMYHGVRPLAHSELAIVYLLAFGTILLVGPGRYSVDAAMGK